MLASMHTKWEVNFKMQNSEKKHHLGRQLQWEASFVKELPNPSGIKRAKQLILEWLRSVVTEGRKKKNPTLAPLDISEWKLAEHNFLKNLWVLQLCLDLLRRCSWKWWPHLKLKSHIYFCYNITEDRSHKSTGLKRCCCHDGPWTVWETRAFSDV